MQDLALASNRAAVGKPFPGCDAALAAGQNRAIPAALSALVHADVYRHEGDLGIRRVGSQTASTVCEILGRLGESFPGECPKDLLLALVATYLNRTSNQSDLAIALRQGARPSRLADTAYEAGFLALVLSVEGAQTFATVLETVKSKRRALGDAALGDGGQMGGASKQWETPLAFAVTISDDLSSWTSGDANVELVIDTKVGQVLVAAAADLLPEFTGIVVEHLKTLAHAIALHPVQLIDRLSCMGEAEKQRIVVDWNRTEAPYSFDGGLVACFEEQVSKSPDQPAVIFRGTTLTYADFNERVNRLARYLRVSGVGPDSFVAICLDRSIEMVVAIWAVLKAGGAYVPLNVEDPPQRLSSIIRNAEAGFVLTDERLAKKLPRTRVKIIRLAPENADVAKHDASNLNVRIAENQLAYMIYTSGSTGEPKGVLIEHKAIHNRILWMQDKYRLTPTDRVLQKTPYTFDVSVWEFLWPLSFGSTLVVAEPGGHVVPSYLIRLMRQEKITCVHFVPSVLRLFLRCPGIEKVPLRMVFCSGEALGTDLRDGLFAKLPSELHNLYGPTEAAVDVTFFSCGDNSRSRRIPIGKPISNIRMHVLDEQLQPVPVGVAGELYIGGVGLARGYWKRPELTTERFIADPLRNEEGQRLYKTGDVARYLPDGNIEYLGRNDHQVKINGARVELGEIEAVIRAHSMVRDTAVIAKKSESGNAQLIAYLVMKENGEGSTALDHLRDHLDRRLPPHMIPRAFSLLPRIPLTASGKVDRKSLPEPQPMA
jgi:amino acid adenylation domain-containing protein